MKAGWNKAKNVFVEALKLAPAERPAFLNKICADDAETRREVESLLSSFDEATSFMEISPFGDFADFSGDNHQPLNNGVCFGHYEIIGQIGAGGMGEVYLAKDKRLDRNVAIKILNQKFAQHESNLERFTKEAKAASALNHPNILVIHEIGETENTHYIVGEYIEGKTLRETLREKPLDLNNLLEIAIQIAAALSTAHAAHIIHRDIKPENIIVRPDGLVKVLDFGLAKLIVNEPIGFEGTTVKENETAKGVILGTVQYMSPEQARGQRVDARSDIFSFGILVYEMLAGRTPFAGDSISETFANLINTEPQPLSRFAANLPDQLQRIVSKMLRKDKDARYQTMKGLLADLKELKENLALNKRLEKSHSSKANTMAILPASTDDATLQIAANDHGFIRQIKRHKTLTAFTALAVLLAAIGFGFWFFVYRAANTKQIESIAVLPFENVSGNAELEYLSDGMTEMLINSLSQLPKLNVKARSSVFRYKGKEIQLAKIGQELNVQAILTGRVMHRGQDLALSVELIDAATENVLWDAIYSRPMTNLTALQSDIARDVAGKLRTRLSSTDRQRVTKSYTDNAEAYRLYLKGRYFWDKRNKEGMENAIKNYNEAIALDPNYALAYAGLADCYLFPQGEPPQVTIPKTRALATKALELDDTLAEAHATLAFIKMRYDYDWIGAEQEFKQSAELNPNYPVTHQFYGTFLVNTGKTDEGLRETNRALELDPLSVTINWSLGLNLYHARRYDEAIAQFQKILQMDASHELTYSSLAAAYARKGMYADAIATQQKLIALRKNSPRDEAQFNLAYIYAVSGRREEARRILEELKNEPKRDYRSSRVAKIYVALGERDEALAWLDRAYENRDFDVIFLKVDPTLDPLRDDPRFQDLMRRVGLPQ